MKERPILFSAPMVRAILEGRKTMTRRVVKPQPPAETPHFRGTIGSYSGAVRPYFFWGRFEDQDARDAYLERPDHDPDQEEDILWPGGDSDGFTCDMFAAESGLLCPFGAAANPFRKEGDRLWVRETWKTHSTFDHLAPRDVPPSNVFYAAGPQAYSPSGSRWRSSIHMPRWASRLTLEITGMRVERLQDISEADAEAEGLRRFPFEDSVAWAWRDGDTSGHASPTGAFHNLWESINGSGSWEANPWVWVVEFKRMMS